MNRIYNLTIACFLISCSAENQTEGYQGQGPTGEVSTVTLPVQKQWKGVYALEDSTVFFSNDFEGARLNGVVADGQNHYTVLITAENAPINPSPWYAFKVWSTDSKQVTIQLTYQDARSRYYPKVSLDGQYFVPLDTSQYQEINQGEGQFGIRAAPESVELTLDLSVDPTWISAQELWTSSQVGAWIDTLDEQTYISQQTIGKSREGRDLQMMSIGNLEAKKAIMIISRQHPPEVTGFLAMKSFIETISGKSDIASRFREEFVVFVVPLMNPDGVDNGHWRHNLGGIDLNRDWQQFNQPETGAVRDLLVSKSEAGYDFVFGADFHSTWDDIYYPIDSSLASGDNMIVYDWIESISSRLPQKRTNISPSSSVQPTRVSRNYFYVNHDMPAIVFELGDNTPRDFLKEKGRVAAEELMRLLSQAD
ncbi:MAG: putative deacylase [Paraglaciecola sp.]|jgi:predicted deacylase